MVLNIRLASTADIDAIVSIDEKAGYNAWSEKTLYNSIYPDSAFLVEVDGQAAAFALFHVVSEDAELLNIVVHPDAQRQGVAQEVLEYALLQLYIKGVRNCFLEVGVNNPAAISLYEKLGFKQAGLRKNYYVFDSGKVDAMVMTKPLEKL